MNQDSAFDRRLVRLAERLGDRYAFLSLLGKGGSGMVYEVENRRLQRREALKVLSNAFREENGFDRFLHEAKVAASLEHPHIVKVFGFGQDDGIPWYSMQLVDGPALSGLLEAGVWFDEDMFMRLVLPLVGALELSHSRGVIHRDIKPANILFNREGIPFLTDFGIAKSEGSVLETRVGHMLGTPAFVAPEQALGEGVDARADQYSLGITLYKTLTGVLPFSADSALETLVLRIKEDPIPLEIHRPDLDPDFTAIIMRMLAREKTQRWATITELKSALLERCDRMHATWNQPVEAARNLPLARLPVAIPEADASLRGSFDPTADLPSRPPKRRTWLLAGAGILALAGTLFWHRWKFPPSEAPNPTLAIGPAPVEATPHAAARPTRATSKNTNPIPGPALGSPVSYPQLLEGPTPTAALPGCAGLRVNVSLRVGADGLVKACRVLSPVQPRCAEAAKSLAMGYRFKPAVDAQGQALETTIATSIDFPEVP